MLRGRIANRLRSHSVGGAMSEAQRGAVIWSTVVMLSAVAAVSLATLAIDNLDLQAAWGCLGAMSVCWIASGFGMRPSVEKMIEDQDRAQ